MGDAVRWGILGTGTIARQMAEALDAAEGAALVAVGSRAAATAEAFGAAFGVPRRHGSYEALVADPEVDVVYVATPHARHAADTRLALAAGKAVLCEKPFALNAAEAREMVAAARGAGRFLMEAMWTRFLPAMVELRARLAAGALGRPVLLSAAFGFRAEEDARSILFDPALGGGALLDVGVYPVSLAHMLWGPPAEVVALAELRGGVDRQSAAALRWAGGELAILAASFEADTAHDADLAGTRARVRIHAPWWRPDTLTLTGEDGREEVVTRPFLGNGYAHQVQAVHEALRAGRTECDAMPLDESVAVMETLDRLRAAFGLRYPGE